MKTNNLNNSIDQTVDLTMTLQSANAKFLADYQQKETYKDKESILETKIDYLDITASGKTQKEAYGKVFDKLKSLIYKKHNNFIIHLEPLDVIKLKDTSHLKLEKFFGLMPHRRLSWEVSLRIVYEVKYILEV